MRASEQSERTQKSEWFKDQAQLGFSSQVKKVYGFSPSSNQ
jgi:hypothetical protein